MKIRVEKVSVGLLLAFGLACMPWRPLLAQQPTATSRDTLPRHAVIGLRVSPADVSKPEDPASNPATVEKVFPGSAGEAAGIREGDILRSLDGQPVTTSISFAHAIARHLATDTVQIEISRQGRKIAKTVALKPRPYETSPDADILYLSLTVEGARRRTIITRPRNAGSGSAASKRYPVVLIMGGLGCYSLDGEFLKPSGYGPILAALNKRDYVTIRVEKTGEGDSEGPACTDPKATAELEAGGYVAALRALKSYDFVDPARVFIFAHSLGPLIGALALPQEKGAVHGFIAAETIGRSWFEYMLENGRRQSALVGEPFDEVDTDVRTNLPCLYHFHVEHQSGADVSKLGSDCAALVRSYAGVPDTYMHQIGDISLAKQWKQLDFPVLVIYGASDPVTSSDESSYLVNLINSFHPGRATYAELPGMGHDFARYASPADFMNRSAAGQAPPHPYDDEILATILDWLSRQSS